MAKSEVGITSDLRNNHLQSSRAQPSIQFSKMLKVHKVVDFVASLILWILIIFLLLPIVFILYIYKSCLIIVARKVDKHLHPTQPNDTYFAMGDTSQVPIVNVAQIWRVDGYLDVNEFRANFRSLFLSCSESKTNYLNLYCYLQQFGGYVFKKSVDQIDIEKHIVVRDLFQEVGSKPKAAQLEQFIVKWMLKEKFAEGRPLWEIVLLHLPNYEDNEQIYFDYLNNAIRNDGSSGAKINNNEQTERSNFKHQKLETIVLLKTHHCLMDGYGFIHIVDKLTGNTAPYLVLKEDETWLQKVMCLLTSG